MGDLLEKVVMRYQTVFILSFPFVAHSCAHVDVVHS